MVNLNWNLYITYISQCTKFYCYSLLIIKLIGMLQHKYVYYRITNFRTGALKKIPNQNLYLSNGINKGNVVSLLCILIYTLQHSRRVFRSSVCLPACVWYIILHYHSMFAISNSHCSIYISFTVCSCIMKMRHLRDSRYIVVYEESCFNAV